MADPCIRKVIDTYEYTNTKEIAFLFYILWLCAHSHAMRQRKVLNDIECGVWLQWMRNCFRKGTINETWKQIETDKWFNTAVQNFVNTEVVGAIFEPNQ